MSRDDKITYVTLSAEHPAVKQGYEKAIADCAEALRRGPLRCPLFIGGVPRETAGHLSSTSPIDTRVEVARASVASRQDFADAIAAARKAFPAWAALPWERRAELLARAAEITRARRFELATWMIHEMGKNWLEALGEVEETADLIDYYNQQMAEQNGFVRPMGRLSPADTNTSVLRPYGVWGVVSPWNFPNALLAAPIAAALLCGNTVVAKPSSETPLAGRLVAEVFYEAGLPEGVLSLLHGPGRLAGECLSGPEIGGLTFTGSYEAGFHALYRNFAVDYPRPCIVEMGGKNPCLVMASADLDRAVRGVHRSAFGMNGHKCSACSRVYVHRAVYDEFLGRLTELTAATHVGDPLDGATFVGPLATRGSHADYQRHVEAARQAGAIHCGGSLLRDGALAHGLYVQPTILTGLPESHPLVREELFVPILHVAPVAGFEEALTRANDTRFGLTAGLFSQDQAEIDAFCAGIEAGVIYVNRAAGATTGAWPGVQPFGGWKASGSTGKNIGGLYTLPCYLREQSRTIVA